MCKCAVLVGVVGVLLAAIGCGKPQQPAIPAAATIDPHKYYAVLLANGSVYFGHLEGLGSAFPVLQDVYYVQSAQNPETKALSNTLVKRGREWHGPDRMIIAEKSIIFIEPVGPDSKVAQLISEMNR